MRFRASPFFQMARHLHIGDAQKRIPPSESWPRARPALSNEIKSQIMMNDIRYGLRQLLKHPGFTLIAVLTLALGIGANTAIFSVVNAVLLKPLPFPAPEQLIAVGMSNSRDGAPRDQLNSLSYPDFFDFREQNSTLQGMAIYRDRSFALKDEKGAQSLRGLTCSAEFFEVLGIKPVIGRDFARVDEQAGGGPGGLKVMLGYDFWQRHFGGDKEVVGRTIELDRRSLHHRRSDAGAFSIPDR